LPDDHLVQMPPAARARTLAPKPSRDYRSKFQHPTSDGFIGEVEPTLGQEILDVSIAEREAQVQPHSMLDDNRRKTVAAIGDVSHRVSLPATSVPGHPVILTMPDAVMALARDRARPDRIPGII
jgi:hypothetical protein